MTAELDPQGAFQLLPEATQRLVRTVDGTLVGTWSVTASDGSDIGTFRTTGLRAGD